MVFLRVRLQQTERIARRAQLGAGCLPPALLVGGHLMLRVALAFPGGARQAQGESV
jgi:hypothetical protein